MLPNMGIALDQVEPDYRTYTLGVEDHNQAVPKFDQLVRFKLLEYQCTINCPCRTKHFGKLLLSQQDVFTKRSPTASGKP